MRAASYRARRRPETGFTLIELLVVTAILALLISMLIPSLVTAREQARITVCMNKLNHIGKALAQYVAANRDMMPPFVYTDEISYNYLLTVNVTDQYGNIWHPTYMSGYIYRNLIGEYMGLGNCMPVRSASDWGPQYTRWEAAMYTHFKEYECPSGVKVESPYGWAVSPSNGRSEGNCYYGQNVSWTSQQQRISGSSWPNRAAYFPLFTDTSSAILIYEQWSCNGGAGGSGDSGGQPYNTHYKMGKKGVEGIGRSILYADWHLTFLRTGESTERPFMLWNQYPYVQRGNDMGTSFVDQWFGKTWMSWDLYQPLKEKG